MLGFRHRFGAVEYDNKESDRPMSQNDFLP